MSDSKVNVNYNPGWLGLLGIIFVLCKIFAIDPVAAWSWWLVLLPFYFGLAIVLGTILTFFVAITAGLGVEVLIDKHRQYKKSKRLEEERIRKNKI